MDAPLIITIFLMALIVAVTAGLWARSRGARPLMGGIGFVLIPLGLFLLGITRLTYNGVISLIDWAQRTVWSTTMTWGATLAGVGLVMVVVSRFIKPAQRRVVEKPASPQVAPRPGAAEKPRGVVVPPTVGKPVAKQEKTSEDAEVEDILRKRGLL
ncbi:MAG: hypothetical protein Q4P15_04665 [Propionibacteriaceae bacterium]|nr:hypothetical protein [Propionibacteriaceae bacterium]